MKSLSSLFIILCVLCALETNLYFALAQKSNLSILFGNNSNVTRLEKILEDDYKFSEGKYDSDEINDIIYRLYDDYLHSDKKDIDHYKDIAVLIDFICSNEFYEKSIEACDIVTQLPLTE
jgi:hypothetical protein